MRKSEEESEDVTGHETEAGRQAQAVAEAVRQRLRDVHPGGAMLEVVERGMRQDQEWWYVPVRPDVQPEHRFEYYEALANVEKDLLQSDHLIVLLVPTVPDADSAAA